MQWRGLWGENGPRAMRRLVVHIMDKDYQFDKTIPKSTSDLETVGVKLTPRYPSPFSMN